MSYWTKCFCFFHPNFIFSAVTFEPDMLESRSKAQKTQIIAWFPLMTSVKNWLLQLGLRARWPWQNCQNIPHLWHHPQNTQI